jgi:hypothetical protein
VRDTAAALTYPALPQMMVQSCVLTPQECQQLASLEAVATKQKKAKAAEQVKAKQDKLAADADWTFHLPTPVVPTHSPSPAPTAIPTAAPTVAPTKAPTVSPTDSPTGTPTSMVQQHSHLKVKVVAKTVKVVKKAGPPAAAAPAATTAAPTSPPTPPATAAPTAAPTPVPPTPAPTEPPTDAPTGAPTKLQGVVVHKKHLCPASHHQKKCVNEKVSATTALTHGIATAAGPRAPPTLCEWL